MVSEATLKRWYGDPRFNGTLTFYTWIRRHIAPASVVLNLGAGPPTNNPLRILKGEVAEVVGADIDPIVLDNPELTEACVIEAGKLPLADGRFDLVFSDYVLEHVEDPAGFLAEVHRVLKPGGHFFFRTPNLFHYVTMVSALTPHKVHTAVANKARHLDEDTHEPWPTFYRMNRPGRLRGQAQKAGFRETDLRMIECEPSYLVFHPVPFYAGVAYERLVNATSLLSGFRSNILGRMTR
jgi:SAM-dependent methyltransferase